MVRPEPRRRSPANAGILRHRALACGGPAALRRRRHLCHRAGRSALAVRQPHRQGRPRAPPPVALRHAVAGRDHGPAGGADRPAHRASLSVGAQRAAARGAGGDGRLGLRLQVQHRLAQAAQGRRQRRPRRRLLFPQRHRAAAVRDARPPCPHARTGPHPGQLSRHPQARAFPQARRTIRPDRILARRGRFSNCSAAAPARPGPPGATRRTDPTRRAGRPTATTRRPTGTPPWGENIASWPAAPLYVPADMQVSPSRHTSVQAIRTCQDGRRHRCPRRFREPSPI